MRKNKFGPVIWAVTPFDENRLKTQASSGTMIDALFGDAAKVRPVCVWDTAAIETRSNAIFSRWEKPKIRGELLSLHVLEAWGGPSAQARALAEYAKKQRASLIVANHHRRTGVKRWFQGSFCESLALSSEVPLLIVPPEWKVASGKKRILFPTDLSAASTAAFDEVVAVAKARGMEIVLYHRAEYPVFIGEEFVYTVSREMASIERNAQREARRKLDEMVARARIAGVKARKKYDRRRGGRPADGILEESGIGYAMVAMAAHNGLLGRIVMGSTSRAVVRESRIPIWVVRTRTAEKRKPSAMRSTPKEVKETEPEAYLS
ncbi:MAG: universal stress protein [Bdellovibrionales bacterium]|nr:universal stress protein [Bdellovibrionales bacterium]